MFILLAVALPIRCNLLPGDLLHLKNKYSNEKNLVKGFKDSDSFNKFTDKETILGKHNNKIRSSESRKSQKWTKYHTSSNNGVIIEYNNIMGLKSGNERKFSQI